MKKLLTVALVVFWASIVFAQKPLNCDISWKPGQGFTKAQFRLMPELTSRDSIYKQFKYLWHTAYDDRNAICGLNRKVDSIVDAMHRMLDLYEDLALRVEILENDKKKDFSIKDPGNPIVGGCSNPRRDTIFFEKRILDDKGSYKYTTNMGDCEMKSLPDPCCNDEKTTTNAPTSNIKPPKLKTAKSWAFNLLGNATGGGADVTLGDSVVFANGANVYSFNNLDTRADDAMYQLLKVGMRTGAPTDKFRISFGPAVAMPWTWIDNNLTVDIDPRVNSRYDLKVKKESSTFRPSGWQAGAFVSIALKIGEESKIEAMVNPMLGIVGSATTNASLMVSNKHFSIGAQMLNGNAFAAIGVRKNL